MEHINQCRKLEQPCASRPIDFESLALSVQGNSRAPRGRGSAAKKLAGLLTTELTRHFGRPCEVSVENLKVRRQSLRGRKFEPAAWSIDVAAPGRPGPLRVTSWSTISECIRAKRLSFSPFGAGLDALPTPQQ
jgi:hypothetical protein